MAGRLWCTDCTNTIRVTKHIFQANCINVKQPMSPLDQEGSPKILFPNAASAHAAGRSNHAIEHKADSIARKEQIRNYRPHICDGIEQQLLHLCKQMCVVVFSFLPAALRRNIPTRTSARDRLQMIDATTVGKRPRLTQLAPTLRIRIA